MARRIFLLAALTAALLVTQATRSLATTTYAAQVSSTLTITGFLDETGAPIAKPADLVVEGDAEVFDLFESELGTASADTMVSVDVFGADPLDLDVAEGTVLVAGASGSTSFPPESSAESASRTDALIFFDNLSATESYLVAFELTVNWFVHASANLPSLEAAGAEVEILLERLPGVALTLLVGQYAQAHYLGKRRAKTLTETVRNWHAFMPDYLPTPHPSWRSTNWLKKNPWFETDVIPELRRRVAALVG